MSALVSGPVQTGKSAAVGELALALLTARRARQRSGRDFVLEVDGQVVAVGEYKTARQQLVDDAAEALSFLQSLFDLARLLSLVAPAPERRPPLAPAHEPTSLEHRLRSLASAPLAPPAGRVHHVRPAEGVLAA